MNFFEPATPYNNLPNLPPKQKELETKAVLKKCIEARSALAELKMAGELIPNQTVLINTIPLLEAKDSSEIENIVTTTDNLFRFAFDDEKHQLPDAATKEALRYRKALHESYKSLTERPLSTATAIEVCSVIKGVEMNIRKIPGTALANDKNGNIIYTPPVGEDIIRTKLSNWERFLHEETTIDPLVRMAVGHYQFEAIHPFSDGNGRTGRVMNLLYLIHENLLHQPLLYLSKYILANRTEYYSLLRKVTEKQDWESWIMYMLEGILETSQWTTNKVIAIRKLIEHTSEHIKNRLPNIYSHELVEILFFQPYCRINSLVDKGVVKRDTASIYLKKLVELGVLEEKKAGRGKIFINSKFFNLLINDDHKFENY